MADRAIVITGAGGNLGQKLASRLDETGGYELRLLDAKPIDDARGYAADLTTHDGSWVRHFEGADAVVHLAGNPRPQSSWDEVIPANIDMVFNVFRAAAEAGVRRVVFASSNFAVSGYRFNGIRLTSELSARPTNPYGATKLFGERLAKGFSESSGTSFVCLRIGFCQRLPGNRPGAQMRHGLWGQRMWLSDRDFCQSVEKSILAENIRFEVLNVMSDNPGMPWDISRTRRVVGFEPEDGAPAVSNLQLALRDKWQSLVDAGHRGLDRIYGGVR